MSLTIITGPMWAGKTSYIIDMMYKLENTNMIVIKHHIDDRYDSECIVTHDKVMVEAMKLKTLTELLLLPEYKESDHILIDEGQFFDDLSEFVREAVDKDGKNVYIAGLLSDYKRRPFDNLYKILPLADNIIFKHGKCAYCDNESVFSKRIVDCKSQVLVGSDSYKPVCRKCYLIK